MRTALVALAVVVACGDNGTPPVVPSASGVFPAQGMVGRHLRVEISGDATTWRDDAVVDFGAGVTVDSVAVASPTALFAELTIDPFAPLGLHDVTVTSGGEMFALAQAFELVSPIRLATQGTVAQGSIARFTIENHDVDNPFDTTHTGDGVFSPIVYTNLQLVGPSGTSFQITDVNELAINGWMLFDVAATPGGLTVISDQVISPVGRNLEVAPRTPMMLGATASGTLATPYDSSLYEIDGVSVPSLVRVAAMGPDSAQTQVAVLRASGLWSDFVVRGASIHTVADQVADSKYYVVVLDLSGVSNYGYTLASQVDAMATSSDADPANDAYTGATALALPALVPNASLVSSADQDWFQVTTGAGDAGKRLHVLTYGDPLTDTVIDVRDAASTASILPGGAVDHGFQEDVTSGALAASTTYNVEVSASQFFSAAHSTYALAVWLEQ